MYEINPRIDQYGSNFSVLSWGTGITMRCLYPYSHMVRGCELTDAMAEAENMRGV